MRICLCNTANKSLIVKHIKRHLELYHTNVSSRITASWRKKWIKVNNNRLLIEDQKAYYLLLENACSYWLQNISCITQLWNLARLFSISLWKGSGKNIQCIPTLLFWNIKLTLSFNMVSCSPGEDGQQSKWCYAGIRTMLIISHGQKRKVLTATEVRVPGTLCF